jgi:hypothetical protein
MEYLITKQDLIDLSKKLYPNHMTFTDIGEFLESKQPVEVMAEGEISTNIYNDDYFIGDISNDKLTDILVGYAGKQVKLYIEVSK